MILRLLCVLAALVLTMPVPAATAQTEPSFDELVTALGRGNTDEITRILTAAPYLLWASDSEGNSALHFATSFRMAPSIDLLLSKGVQAAAVNNNGFAPGQIARSAGDPEIAAKIEQLAAEQIVVIKKVLAELGYDPGPMNGEMNDTTVRQLGMFAAAAGMPGPATAAVLRALLYTDQTLLWGSAMTLTVKGEPGWTSHYLNFRGDRTTAANAMLDACAARPDQTDCKIMFMLPNGACVAAARQRGPMIWSGLYGTLAEAEADALQQCRDRGFTKCALHHNFCVGH